MLEVYSHARNELKREAVTFLDLDGEKRGTKRGTQQGVLFPFFSCKLLIYLVGSEGLEPPTSCL